MSPSIGAAIRQLRHRRGLSQKKIEEMTHGKVKAGWIASVETDRLELISEAQTERLEVLAALLGTTVLEIYQAAGIVGVPRPAGSSTDETHLIETYRSLSPADRRRACRILDDLASAESLDTEEEYYEDSSSTLIGWMLTSRAKIDLFAFIRQVMPSMTLLVPW